MRAPGKAQPFFILFVNVYIHTVRNDVFLCSVIVYIGAKHFFRRAFYAETLFFAPLSVFVCEDVYCLVPRKSYGVFVCERSGGVNAEVEIQRRIYGIVIIVAEFNAV